MDAAHRDFAGDRSKRKLEVGSVLLLSDAVLGQVADDFIPIGVLAVELAEPLVDASNLKRYEC